MKKIILLFVIITLVQSCSSVSPTIVRNETDEYTQQKVIETSWVSLIKEMSLYSYSRLRQIGGTNYLDFKLMTIGSDVYAVEKGEVLYLKFADEEIMKLSNDKYKISNLGEGAIGNSGSKAMGISFTFGITDSQLKKLQNKIITGIRLYTSDGYFEADIKEKNAIAHNELMKLIKI